MTPQEIEFSAKLPDRIFTKNFIALALINLLIMVAYYLLFVISGPYALEHFQVSPSTGGLVAGLMVLGCLAGRFVTGHFIGQAGCRTVLFVGIGIYTLSMGCYFLAHTLPLFMLVRFLSGVGVGCMGTATGTIVACIVPPGKRGLGISYFSLSSILALALGPFLGLALRQAVSYEMMFLICMLTGIGSLFIAFTLPHIALALSHDQTHKPASSSACFKAGEQGASAPHGEVNSKPSLFKLSNYIDYCVLPFATVVLLTGVCYSTVQAFISFFATQQNLVAAASLFFLVYAVVVLLSRPFTGRLFDKRGENIIVYPALALMGFGFLLLSQATSAWMMLLAGGLLGAGFGNFQSIAQALVLKLVPMHRFGQATSTFFIFLDFGIGLGPYLFGFVVPFVGYNGVYLLSAGVAFVAIPFYVLMHGRGSFQRI